MLLLLAAAMVLGAIAERLKQSAVVGYMLAGVIIGPMIAADDTISAISQLGIALLLFSVGLEFSFDRLKRSGVGPWILGGCQVVVTMFAVMMVCAWRLGMTAKGAFVVGAALSLSSTAVVLRALQERAEVDTMHGRRSLGILLFQDLAVIPLVLIVSSLGQGRVGTRASARRCWSSSASPSRLFVRLLPDQPVRPAAVPRGQAAVA
jgi:CPA2 family monovalent cation:H+ antiporter-2